MIEELKHWKEDSCVCPGCPDRGPQALENFYNQATRPNGKTWECKVCMNQRCYQWRMKQKKPRTIPAHGNKARYRKGCRCEHCVKAESKYRKMLYIAKRKPYVTSDFARAHLSHLASTPYQAAKVVGISHSTAVRIMRDGKRIRAATERKVLAA